MNHQKIAGLLLAGLALSVQVRSQYIHEIIEYLPAPGQYINSTAGNPDAANSIIGTTTGLVSLGSFGGYIVFRFEKPVLNDPGNPYGVDFTIFGNSVGSWSEPGIVSVMMDENRNSLADDTWYELAGSEYQGEAYDQGYQVTYTNPGGDKAKDVFWKDNRGNEGYVYANSIHTQSYYPGQDEFPEVSRDQYMLGGTRIYAAIDSSDNLLIHSPVLSFGYADNHERANPPYTLPDNPYTPETEGAGGDPMDLSWAVDESGQPVELDSIHFIRVHSAVNGHAGILGEISTEICGAVRIDKTTAIPPQERTTGNDGLIRLFPNPCQNVLQTEVNCPVRWTLYNVSGQVLRDLQLSEGHHTINLSSLSKGIYILQAIMTEGSETHILIKE